MFENLPNWISILGGIIGIIAFISLIVYLNCAGKLLRRKKSDNCKLKRYHDK